MHFINPHQEVNRPLINSFILGITSFNVLAKNMNKVVGASVELQSEEGGTENGLSTDVNVGQWATLSYPPFSKRFNSQLIVQGSIASVEMRI